MKKFTLIAAAALVAFAANAEARKVANARGVASQPAAQRTVFNTGVKKLNVVNKTAADVQSFELLSAPSVQRHAAMTQPMTNLPVIKAADIQSVVSKAPKASSVVRKAPASMQEAYAANGVIIKSSTSTTPASWTMYVGNGTYADGTTADLLFDVIPDNIGISRQIPDYSDGVYVEFQTKGNQIAIEPAYIATVTVSSGEEVDIWMLDYASIAQGGDGTVYMTVGQDGSLTIDDPRHVIGYFACAVADDFNAANIKGAFEQVGNITYGEGGGSEDEDIELLNEYVGVGFDESVGTNAKWEAYRIAYKGETLFADFAGNPMESIGVPEVDVIYEQEGNVITIPAQLVAKLSYRNTPVYCYMCDANASDGAIRMTVDAEGRLTYTGSTALEVAYPVYYTDAFNPDCSKSNPDFLQYMGYYSDVQLYLPGEEPHFAPTVSFEDESLVLFAGMSISGYTYFKNLAMTGANQPMSFVNTTKDNATSWQWHASKITVDGGEDIVGSDRDFSFMAEANEAYTGFSLIGADGDKASEPYNWAIGYAENVETGLALYDSVVVYSGASQNFFGFSDGSNAIMSALDPNKDMAFYTNWATPDKASNSMSKIYCYHNKPAGPLYIQGIELPLYAFTASADFELTVKIAKYDEDSDDPAAYVLAEGVATIESVETNNASGLSVVHFDELFVEDEDGMFNVVDHLFLEDAFWIIIEGWDNGTFSGIIASTDWIDQPGRQYTWFEMSGEPGSLYAYTSWHTPLFIGLSGATYGYLMTDNKTVEIPADGGEVSVKINPMLSYVEPNEGSQTILAIDENVEIPDWLSITLTDENYDDDNYFVLTFAADAIAADSEGRVATIRFWQPGAYLDLTVGQGAMVAGIEAIGADAPKAAQLYNLYGMPVQAGYQGVVVGKGVKALCK